MSISTDDTDSVWLYDEYSTTGLWACDVEIPMRKRKRHDSPIWLPLFFLRHQKHMKNGRTDYFEMRGGRATVVRHLRPRQPNRTTIDLSEIGVHTILTGETVEKIGRAAMRHWDDLFGVLKAKV